MNSEHWRLFVAISIPETIRNELAAIQNSLSLFANALDVRWTRPEQLHLTLKFLGNVPIESLGNVKQSLAGACASNGPFSLRVREIGFFPHARSPRVIWVGFDDKQDTLAVLQSHVARLLAPFAENAETEDFLPHATIGRFQKFRRHKTEKLSVEASKFSGKIFGEWRVDSVELFRSETLPDGVRYTVLSSFPLMGTPPA